MWLLLVVAVVLAAGAPRQTAIDRVHIVFSCHLDVGYADLIANIVNRYFDTYFAGAMATSDQLRRQFPQPGGPRYSFMTHSWLASMYLDCPAGLGFHCPNATALSAFKAAVLRGDIWWHAYAFNSEPEGYPDASMFEFGVQMTHALDKQFGLPPKQVMSQRDVPGMTRGVVPLLAKHGVTAFSIGVNGDCAPPATPKIFRWIDTASNASVYGMVHAGGYGGIGLGDCATAPGLDAALAFAWRTDNTGPHSVDEVLAIYKQLQSEYPGASVFASTFDRFVDELAAADRLGLVTLHNVTAEMGDTWIYGYASDPRKMSDFRAFSAVRNKCLREGWCSLGDYRVFNASRFLLKLAEHTWGLYGIVGDGNPPYWGNEAFDAHRNDSGFQVAAQSYAEQARYVQHALSALGSHPLARAVAQELQALTPVRPSLAGLARVDAPHFGQLFQCGTTISVAVDAETGAVVSLKMNGATVATPVNRVAELAYSTYDAADFAWFPANYSYFYGRANAGFVKPRLDDAVPPPVSRTWRPMLLELYWTNSSSRGCRLVERLGFGNLPTVRYGAPNETWVEIDLDPYSGQDVNVIVSAFGKRPTRMPEAMWVTYNPVTSGSGAWWLNKLGAMVNPLDVMVNGSQAQHAVARSLSAFYGNTSDGTQADFAVSSLDALIVSPTQSPFPAIAPLTAADTANGMSFNLFNNVWNTNFPLFYPYNDTERNRSLLFRFELESQLVGAALK